MRKNTNCKYLVIIQIRKHLLLIFRIKLKKRKKCVSIAEIEPGVIFLGIVKSSLSAGSSLSGGFGKMKMSW